MRLMRWEPFREMDDLLKGFGPMLGRVPTLARPADGGYEFMPLADVIEREKEYLIKVDLPDVRKEDVKVLFDAGVLTIKGERKVEKETKGETVHRTERFYGVFERGFALPDDAIHSPNERMLVANLGTGVRAAMAMLTEFAQ